MNKVVLHLDELLLHLNEVRLHWDGVHFNMLKYFETWMKYRTYQRRWAWRRDSAWAPCWPGTRTGHGPSPGRTWSAASTCPSLPPGTPGTSRPRWTCSGPRSGCVSPASSPRTPPTESVHHYHLCITSR